MTKFMIIMSLKFFIISLVIIGLLINSLALVINNNQSNIEFRDTLSNFISHGRSSAYFNQSQGEWILIERNDYYNKYRRPWNDTAFEYKIEHSVDPINYLASDGWRSIDLNIKPLDPGYQAWHYNYRAYAQSGNYYNVYFKRDPSEDWTVAFAYNKSDDPTINVLRSQLNSIGYYDPSQEHDYEILQNVQSGSGTYEGNIGVYENIFTSINAYWVSTKKGIKENILLSNQTRTLLIDNPPSDYGLSNLNSYLVTATKLDYLGLYPYLDGVNMTGNFTTGDTTIDFRDALGHLKFSFPVGRAYERYKWDNTKPMVNRLVKRGGYWYLLSGIRIVDLYDMQFPVVLDPVTIGGYITQGSDDCDVMQTAPYTVDTTSGDATTGNWNNVEYDSYWLYRNLSVMHDALVTNCYMSYDYCPVGGWEGGTLEVDIHTIYELNTSTFSQADNPRNRTMSDNYTEWDVWLQHQIIGYMSGNTPSFHEAAEELINITGWSQTWNRFGVGFRTNAPNGVYKQIATYENTYGGFGLDPKAPRLYMSYVPPGNVPPDKPFNPVPANNSHNIDKTPTLYVNVTDANDDIVDVTYYSNYSHYNYEYLSPNKNGSLTQLSQSPVSAHDANYKYVNESYGETNDSDLVYNYFTMTEDTDLYNITNHTIDQEDFNIQEISVWARNLKSNKHYPLQQSQYDNKIKLVIKSNGTTTYSSAKSMGITWEWDYETWITNPHNESNPWMWDDLDDLEIGIVMYGKVYDYSKCSQVYLRIKTDEHAFWAMGTDYTVQTPGVSSYVATVFTEPLTTYYWLTNVSDGEFTNESDIWHFTTGCPLSQFELTYPTNNSYNETSPVNLNVTITSPSGQTTDITWFEYHTLSNTYSTLDIQTGLGNGTHTYSWGCGDGYKRWYAEGQIGNWTVNTTDPIDFYSNDVWDDHFWDSDRIESYTAGVDNSFTITENSWVNFTYGATYGAYVNGMRYTENTPSPQSFFINETHGYVFHYDTSPTYFTYTTTKDGGRTWTQNTISTGEEGRNPSLWFDNWTSGGGKEEIYLSYYSMEPSAMPFTTYFRIRYRLYNITTDTFGSSVVIQQYDSPFGDAPIVNYPSICKTPNGTLWVAYTGYAGTTGNIEYSDDNGASWTANSPGLTFIDSSNDRLQVLPLENNNIMLVVSDESADNISYFIRWSSNNTWSNRKTLVSDVKEGTYTAMTNKTNTEVYLSYINDTASNTGALNFTKYNGVWNTPVILKTGYFYDTALSIDNETYRITNYYSRSPGDAYDTYTVNSTDYGVSWGSESLINDGRIPSSQVVTSSGICFGNNHTLVYQGGYVTGSMYYVSPVYGWDFILLGGNLTSVNITLPLNHYWGKFNVDIDTRVNVTFSILNATDGSILMTNLTGENDDISNLSRVINGNDTIQIYGQFNTTMHMDKYNISWVNIGTEVNDIIPYIYFADSNESNNTLNLTAIGATDLDNVTLYYRYSPDNVTWDNTSFGYRTYYENFSWLQADGKIVYREIGAIVDPDHAFLLVYTAQYAALPDEWMVTGYVYNTTHIILQRTDNADSDNLYVSWFVVECFGNEFNVTRGHGDMAAGIADVEVSVSVNYTRSMVIGYTRVNSTTATALNADDGYATIQLNDTSTVYVKRATTGVAATAWFSIITWSEESNAIVYTDELTLTNPAEITDNIGGIVDQTSTWMFFTYDASVHGLQQTSIYGEVISNTQLIFGRYSSTVYTNRIRWYLVDIPGATVANESYTWLLPAVTDHRDNALSPVVDKDYSFIQYSASTSGTGTAYARSRQIPYFWDNPDPGDNWRSSIYYGGASPASHKARALIITLPEYGFSYNWIKNETDDVYPWNWTFSFPNGTGYYEFYSIGQKALLEIELSPLSADARCFFTYAIIVLSNEYPVNLSTIQYYFCNTTFEMSITRVNNASHWMNTTLVFGDVSFLINHTWGNGIIIFDLYEYYNESYIERLFYDTWYNWSINCSLTNNSNVYINHSYSFYTETEVYCMALEFESTQFGLIIALLMMFFFFYIGYTSPKRSGGGFMILSAFIMFALEAMLIPYLSAILVIPFISPIAFFILLLGIRKQFYKFDKEKTSLEGADTTIK